MVSINILETKEQITGYIQAPTSSRYGCNWDTRKGERKKLRMPCTYHVQSLRNCKCLLLYTHKWSSFCLWPLDHSHQQRFSVNGFEGSSSASLAAKVCCKKTSRFNCWSPYLNFKLAPLTGAILIFSCSSACGWLPVMSQYLQLTYFLVLPELWASINFLELLWWASFGFCIFGSGACRSFFFGGPKFGVNQFSCLIVNLVSFFVSLGGFVCFFPFARPELWVCLFFWGSCLSVFFCTE